MQWALLQRNDAGVIHSTKSNKYDYIGSKFYHLNRQCENQWRSQPLMT